MRTLEERVTVLENDMRELRAREERMAETSDKAHTHATNAHVTISELFNEFKEFRHETRSSLHGLTETVKHHGVLLRNIARQLDDHSSRLGRMEQAQQEHGVRLDGIEQRQQEHGTMLQEHRTRLDGIDSRLEGIGGRLDGIGGRLDRLEVSQVAANRMLQEILEHVRK